MPGPSSAEALTNKRVLSVSQLSTQLKEVVEQSFFSVWVAGEISNFTRPQSGHCYFTLKDEVAQLRAVVWRTTVARLNTKLHDGMEVICRGRVDVYPPRGSYQLVIEELQPRGIGALELALRKLREKLATEGLFDANRKRSLPKFPRRIGFVTSPTGAAIHDFLQVLQRRWRGVHVLVFPVRVQGEGAADEIAEGIRQANRLQPSLDVLVVGRGGGSLEDLWAFNEEPVVRAIAASKVPIVSAVGHEIDVTLADLAADVRALTPTEAAERVVPSAQEMVEVLQGFQSRMVRFTQQRLDHWRQRLDSLSSRPALARPLDGIHNLSRQVDDLGTRLHGSIRIAFREQKTELARISGKLETLSPLAVLSRGYSLTQDRRTGRLVSSAAEVKAGQKLLTRLAEGVVVSTVDAVELS